MLKVRIVFAASIALLLLAACGTATPPAAPPPVEVPVTVEVTRIVEVQAEVTVEVPVEVPVEVTRIVEVQAEVTVEVPVEVTRLVEVTATPEPTPTPEPTAVPAPTTTAANGNTNQTAGFSDANLLDSMNTLRSNLLELGGMLDSRMVYCDVWLEKFDRIAGLPTYDTTNANDTSKWAYGQYRAAIDTFKAAANDMTQNARNNCQRGGSIPYQQGGMARQGINQATDILQPAIKALGGE